MDTREFSVICLVPLNHFNSMGRLPTATHVIVTSADTLASVFAGAVTIVAGTAGRDKHNKLTTEVNQRSTEYPPYRESMS